MRWILRQIRAAERLLDIGFASTGVPILFRALRSRNQGGITVGMDINLEGVLSRREPTTVAGDAFHLPFTDRAFDVVLLAEVLEHVERGANILAEARRVLVPGGRLVVTTPNPYYLNRWLARWLLAPRRSVLSRSSVRTWLGAEDHELNWEPASLAHRLHEIGFQVERWTTVQHGIPFLRRVVPALSAFDLPFWPFDRVGGYFCLVAMLDRP
ncbi:MAG: class I SAM-dependent methyltransferase [Planctomycetes bacterium]|nr:class I SAM-dependent methyltransferase [Planctomycetota bacterium]